MDREKVIIKTSIVGIAGNVVLVIIKMLIGLATNSIAIILDAINNLSDAMSSIITIVGTKLAGKAPDKEHPYGYGRIEYLTSVIISVIVLVAGVTSFKSSVENIIHPEPADYTVISLIIIAIAVVVKIVMGTYVKGVGKKINSTSLVASGQDALGDAVISIATLVAAFVSLKFGYSIEAWLGAIISIVIIKAGFELLMEGIGSIIGTRAEQEMVQALKARVNQFEYVNGAYDVILHNYGPNQNIGSVHIEVDDSLGAREIHALTHEISKTIAKEMNIILTVGIYASNVTDPECVEMKKNIDAVIEPIEEVKQAHGLFIKGKEAQFDIVVDFKADFDAVRERVRKGIQEKYPDFTFTINMDSFFSDI